MAQRDRRRSLRAGLAALTSALLLPLGAGLASAAPAPGPAPGADGRKIEPALGAQLDASDKAVFWVYLDSAADLTEAGRRTTRTAKAETVLRLKRDHAARSQAELLKALDGAHAEYTSYWIVNAVRVVGGRKLAGSLAQRPEVSRIDADDKVTLPAPAVGTREKTADAVEWNIDRIKAPQVWDQLGVRGEGIVVANIDSGVDHTHPAVAGRYRGRNADGSYDHNHNWFDPAGICAGAAPCDNNDHGTHTMGTMVGDDGGANKIGVAPGARWIAAKGCESNSCSEASLLAAGQWIVAPTDLNGQNPRPDLAPHVVNNSWGSSAHDDWYQQIVDTWRAAGIFPAFSNGNSGPNCSTSGSPGDYAHSYSSGAFDVNNAIAPFSSRGAGPGGIVKPNIAAPGVNVRSSVPGGAYESFSGTSMASPHTAATVALLWSAAPSLAGDVAQTEALLDGTAQDTDSGQCGGTTADNNVFGEGRLDALAAVTAAPRGAVGALAGTVRAEGGEPVAGAKVTADGPIARTTTTAADGSYRFPALSVGAYALTASKFGYGQRDASATVSENATATGDFTLARAPSGTLTGTVSGPAGPAAGAAVTVAGTPVTATTDDRGRFEVTLPHGTYDVNATHSSRCVTGGTAKATVAGDTTVTVTLPERADGYGYACATASGRPYPAGDQRLALTGDNTTERVDLPFPLPLYGKTYGQAWIGTNGTVSFGGNHTGDTNGDLPSTSTPNAALYPFWDDLVVGPAGSGSGVFTAVTGTAPHRSYVIEWRAVSHWSAQADTFSFSAAIGEDGTVTYSYKGTGGTGIKGGSTATVGVENATGTDAFRYSFNTPVLTDGLSVAFRTTRSGVVTGRVLDANDGNGVAGATVTVGSGDTAVSATTAADGGYVVQSASGPRTVTLTAPSYEPAQAAVEVKAADVTTADRSLRTGKVTAAKPSVEIVLPAGQRRTRTVDLTNPGLGSAFAVSEDAAWLTATPADGTLPTGGRSTLTLTADTTGLTPGTVLSTGLRITSDSGRSPVLTVPVKIVVPRYQAALDAGSEQAATDALGDSWSPDRAYTAGSYGYQGSSTVRSTGRTIAGTTDQRLFRTARENMYEYRFDNVPNGTYTVELGFAELSDARPDKRVFDVLAEGAQVLPSLDISLEAGTYTALTRTYTVTVTDGVLNVRFVTHKGYGKPLISTLRVTDRPDKP
ncbi:S8 family serine peptidase [Streptomyces sp. NBC_00249]|uniref:S8 family serine peptidase n=1 Tax=Streptomyces sp. NBC_00249 TaxID=2975690 RepID=UPI00225900A5|nr:S8 family serine peptidase [Streptomyces sp. NBC_00249]MCX5192688.1 S8 family serine peptidase [Streptomyces sp. NBC_00249]